MAENEGDLVAKATEATQVVSGPVTCNCLSILRSWIITRVPRVR